MVGEKLDSFFRGGCAQNLELIPNCGGKGVSEQFVAHLSVGSSVWVCQTDLWTLVSRAGHSRSGRMHVASLYLHQAPTVAAPVQQLVVLPLEHELKHRLAITMKLFPDNSAV